MRGQSLGIDPQQLTLALIPFLGAALGIIGGFYAGRRASVDTYSDLSLAWEKDRTATAILRDDVGELLERTVMERKRVVGERSRMEAPKQGQQGLQPVQDIAGLDREAQLTAVRARYGQ